MIASPSMHLKEILPLALGDTGINLDVLEGLWVVINGPWGCSELMFLLSTGDWSTDPWHDDILLFDREGVAWEAGRVDGMAANYADIVRRGRADAIPLQPLSRLWWDWSL